MRSPFCDNIGKENRNGGIAYETYNENHDFIFSHPVLSEIGAKYGKTAAQIAQGNRMKKSPKFVKNNT